MNAVLDHYRKKYPKHILSYVRSKSGHIKGVIVAVGKYDIGWSLVSDEDNYHYLIPLHGLPAVQHLIHENENLTVKELFNSPAYKNFVSMDGVTAVPDFNKNKGISLAFKRASVAVTNSDPLPKDSDFVRALRIMQDRAYKYFKD